MNSIKAIARSARLRTRTTLFGNNHSVGLNVRYLRYEQVARKSWRPRSKMPPDVMEAANRFTNLGYEVLPPPSAFNRERLVELKAKVDRLFDEQSGGYVVNYGMRRLIDGLELVPEVIDMIDGDAEAIIENMYQSHFKIFAASFYRTVQTTEKEDASFLWHIDNCPRPEIKMMVYLDDVSDDTGAFRLKTKTFTQGIQKEGFFDRRRIAKFVDRLEDASTTRVCEGPVGTRVLFANGGCVHKATSPRKSHRDVVSFVIIPSDIHWRVHYARNRNFLSTNAGICIDPFRDVPENVGYHF